MVCISTGCEEGLGFGGFRSSNSGALGSGLWASARALQCRSFRIYRVEVVVGVQIFGLKNLPTSLKNLATQCNPTKPSEKQPKTANQVCPELKPVQRTPNPLLHRQHRPWPRRSSSSPSRHAAQVAQRPIVCWQARHTDPHAHVEEHGVAELLNVQEDM